MHASSKMLWVRSFLQELGFLIQSAMPTYCDNQATIFLANNPTFHERTKHIESDCHTIRHQVLDAFFTTRYVGSSYQLPNILTKGLSTTSYDSIFCKLGLFDLYALAWGGVWVYSGHNGTFVILDLLLSPLPYMSLFSSLIFLNKDHFLIFHILKGDKN